MKLKFTSREKEVFNRLVIANKNNIYDKFKTSCSHIEYIDTYTYNEYTVSIIAYVKSRLPHTQKYYISCHISKQDSYINFSFMSLFNTYKNSIDITTTNFDDIFDIVWSWLYADVISKLNGDFLICDKCDEKSDTLFKNNEVEGYEEDNTEVCYDCFMEYTSRNEICPICLNNGAGVWKKNKNCHCREYYHFECIRRVDICPTCRKPITEYDTY